MDTDSSAASATVWESIWARRTPASHGVDEFGRAVVVNNRDGDPTTPSVVMFIGPDNIQVVRRPSGRCR